MSEAPTVVDAQKVLERRLGQLKTELESRAVQDELREWYTAQGDGERVVFSVDIQGNASWGPPALQRTFSQGAYSFRPAFLKNGFLEAPQEDIIRTVGNAFAGITGGKASMTKAIDVESEAGKAIIARGEKYRYRMEV